MSRELYDIEILFKLKQGQDWQHFGWTVELREWCLEPSPVFLWFRSLNIMNNSKILIMKWMGSWERCDDSNWRDATCKDEDINIAWNIVWYGVFGKSNSEMRWRFRSTSIFQVEVPQAAVVTDYSDAIVIDQEVRGRTFILLKSWIFFESPRLLVADWPTTNATDIKIPIIIHIVIYVYIHICS